VFLLSACFTVPFLREAITNREGATSLGAIPCS
jgi:hypothetical protein